MVKRRLFLLTFVLVAVLAASVAIAQPPRPAKARQVDRNKDGRVDKKEIYIEKKVVHDKRAKVNNWWEDRADTNNDGRVDDGELAAWKKVQEARIDINKNGVIDARERRLSWRHARARVNTPLEKKYDANANGWLEPEEVKELIKDRYRIISTDGKAVVDTSIEREYDSNGDGVIDIKEVRLMMKDAE